MKRLISTQEVLAAAASHTDLVVDKDTIVTAQARDIAAEKGVKLVEASVAALKPEKVVELNVCEGAGCGGHAEPAVSAEEIERLITQAFKKGLWTKDDIETLFGISAEEETVEDPDCVTVGVSGRHVHLSQADLETLFGKGYELTKIKDLSQPGQYAAKECVTLVGPKGVIQRVRVLGPVRPETQVEILAGDTFTLGVPKAVCLSGHLEGTPGITLVGPKGTVVLSRGVMVAARHIHMSPQEAEARGLHDGQIVSIRFEGDRGGVLDNVIVRATDSGALDCHIDTEEANALGLSNGSVVRIVR